MFRSKKEGALQKAKKLNKKAEITTRIGSTPRAVFIEAEAIVAKEKQNLTSAQIELERSLFTLAPTDAIRAL